MKKIISFMLALSMSLCIFSFNANAAVSAGQTLTSQDTYGSVTMTANTGDQLIDMKTQQLAGYAPTIGIFAGFNYGKADRIDSSYAGRVFPVSFSSGGYILLQSILYSGETGVSVDIYTDAACQSKLDGGYIYSTNQIKSNEIIIPAAGTYYIKVANYNSQTYGSEFTNSVGLSVSFFPNKELTIKPGMVYQTGCQDNAEYFKYTASVNGYVIFEVLKDEGYIYDSTINVEMCNSGKKVVSEKEYIYSSSATAFFGVKKGKTYYFKVTSAEGLLAVRCKQTAVAEKSGASKNKAKILNKGKNAAGTIAAEDKTADWYKIKVTKSNVLNFIITGNASGSIKFTLYKSNGKKWAPTATMVDGIGVSKKLYTTKAVSKGTYYIKIERGNAKSSGNYTFKWK